MSESHGFHANFAKYSQAEILYIKNFLTKNKEWMANMEKSNVDKDKHISDLSAKLKEIRKLSGGGGYQRSGGGGGNQQYPQQQQWQRQFPSQQQYHPHQNQWRHQQHQWQPQHKFNPQQQWQNQQRPMRPTGQRPPYQPNLAKRQNFLPGLSSPGHLCFTCGYYVPHSNDE